MEGAIAPPKGSSLPPPPASPARAAFFSGLKPHCVRISQLAIKPPQDGTYGARELAAEAKQLLAVLGGPQMPLLDDNLAEYTFFPLSHVLRNLERYPLPLVETVVQCIEVLIVHGWKARITAQQVQQFLTLFTFIIDGTPGKEKKDGITKKSHDVPEETSVVVFNALTALLSTAAVSVAGSAGLVEQTAMPNLGHSITVMLEGVTDGKSPEVQLAALRAVDSVFRSVKDHAALATFLPGTVSALTKMLSSPAHHKRRVLSAGLVSLKKILVGVLSDMRLRNVPKEQERRVIDEHGEDGEEDEEVQKDKNKVLGPAWVKATSFQIKLALSSILGLRNSTEEEVQKPLERLCISLVDECHASLGNCVPLLVETAIILASPKAQDAEGFQFSIDTTLEDLVGIHTGLNEVIKTTVYDWMISLPRVMQSSDEGVKMRALRDLSKGIRTISDLHIESATLRDSAAAALRDSVAALMAASNTSKVVEEVQDTSLLSSDVAVSDRRMGKFAPVVMSQGSQTRTRQELVNLLANLGAPSQQTRLALELLESARDSAGNDQVSSYWLSYQLLRQALTQKSDVDDLLDLSALDPTGTGDVEAVFNDLFTFSVSIIDSHTEADETDWRLEAIALEVTTFAAARLGEAFRPELIDVLYPTATFLGSDSPQLRHHAMVSLNSIAASCGYDDVSALIVDNVDYMVNSVALRLNTLDITPASTKVLTMMVRLAGPRLIPFLDDVVASIFSALESYHGYALFVENLFGVLKEIAEQGVKSDVLLLEGTKAKVQDHKKKPERQTTLEDILEELDRRRERIQMREEEDRIADAEGKYHPKEAWGPPKDDKANAEGAGEGDYDDRDPNEEEETPTSPTYQLLLKIADLTQHYLTSPTPTLRKSLLDLLGTVAPALGSNEDKFLPLIHTVWPVVISRLYDTEPYIAIAACDAIHMLCSAAGDFLSSRIKTEWKDKMHKWCRDVKARGSVPEPKSRGGGNLIYDRMEGNTRDIRIPGRADAQSSLSLSLSPSSQPQSASKQLAARTRSGGLGRFAQSARLWDGVVRLLTGIVSYVRVDDETFDDMLELLEDAMLANADIREALEAVNADAVWYATYRRGMVEWRPAPVLEGESFPEMERIGTAPGGGGG